MKSMFKALSCLGVMMIMTGVSHAQDVSDQQVLEKMDSLKKELMGTLQGDNWETRNPHAPYLAQEAGETSLVLYALLASGEDPQRNPKLMQVIQWLEDQEINGNYAVALRAHVWAKLPPRYLKILERDAQLLVDGLRPEGDVSYYLGLDNTPPDSSNTQYNMLGVWEAAKRGIEFSGDYWERVENYFLRMQLADGGWGYRTGFRNTSYGSMTAAGLTCLFISNDYLHTMKYKKPGAGATIPTYQAIQRGLDWFQKNFDPTKNPGAPGGVTTDYPYYIVGVERAGLASGYKYFKNIDWYRSISNHIVTRGGKIKGSKHNGQSVTKAFQLVFLAAGRKPVMINKLKTNDIRWDNRPRDVAKLAAWTSQESEKGLLWQVIELDRSANDFMDAPILYLASDQAFEPSETNREKIKNYIDMGGLFFTTSDTDSSSFDASIEQLAKQMYPDYKWHKIPSDHFVYNLVYPTDANKTPLYGIHNGARYLVIHSGRDLAWSFHSGNMARRDDWHTMANIFHYASERGRVRPKLAIHAPIRNGKSGQSKEVARVMYDGNWNPEPSAWKAANVFMNNEGKVSITLSEVELTSLPQSSVKFAHLAGAGDYEFTETDLEHIKLFAEAGGTILIEAVGGENEFYTMAINKLSEMGQLEMLDPSHDLIKGETFSGYDTSHIAYRPYRTLTQNQKHPSLQAIMVNGQPRILFSGDDLSNALLNQPAWGIFGYNHESALQLMTNIVLWSNR